MNPSFPHKSSSTEQTPVVTQSSQIIDKQDNSPIFQCNEYEDRLQHSGVEEKDKYGTDMDDHKYSEYSSSSRASTPPKPSSPIDKTMTEIISKLKDEIIRQKQQNSKLRDIIDQQNGAQNEWIEKENNYILDIKRYEAQIKVLSEKVRALENDNERATSASSETSVASDTNYQYKMGMHCDHLEPIIDDEPEVIEDVVIENFDCYDKYEHIKHENETLKQVIIELRAKSGDTTNNDIFKTAQQKYDDIKKKFDAIIALTRLRNLDHSFFSRANISYSGDVIVEDIINAYIGLQDEYQLMKGLKEDLEQRNQEYKGLVAENEKDKRRYVTLIAKWRAYKQDVVVWKEQVKQLSFSMQHLVSYAQALSQHAQALSQHNQIQAQQMVAWYNRISELEQKHAGLVGDYAEIKEDKQELMGIYKKECGDYKKWRLQDIINWIINIDRDRFKEKYDIEVLYNNMVNKGWNNGYDMIAMTEDDLQGFGIMDHEDREIILKHVEELIYNYDDEE